MNNRELQAPEMEQPYWDGLDEGYLSFQRCRSCDTAWLPARWECPTCLDSDWAYEKASGRGRLVSWAVYHKAYHPSVEDRLPYNVAIVELEEGPLLITNITGEPDAGRLAIDVDVTLAIEQVDGVPLPRFGVVDRFSSTPRRTTQ